MFCKKKADEQKTKEAFQQLKKELDELKFRVAKLEAKGAK